MNIKATFLLLAVLCLAMMIYQRKKAIYTRHWRLTKKSCNICKLTLKLPTLIAWLHFSRQIALKNKWKRNTQI